MIDEHEYPYPWRLMGVVALIVVAATVLVGLVVSRSSVDDSAPIEASAATPAPDLRPVEKQRQVTLLLQVRDRGGAAVSNVLIGVGGDTGHVAELMLPRDLLLPTVPATALQDTDGPTGPVSAQEPVQTLLGVQVDASIDLDRLAWAGLLDSIGESPTSAHASYPSSFPLVLDSVLARLPVSEQDIGQLLTSLGSMARTTVTNEDASHLLALIGVGMRTDGVQRETLPVTTIRAGPTQVSIIRQPAADTVLLRLFPKAQLQPGHSGATRVVVERTGASLGAGTNARLALVAAGFGVVERRSDGPGQQSSIVHVPVGSEAAIALGREVASVLGLPASSVLVDAGARSTVDVRVVLGSGYQPM